MSKHNILVLGPTKRNEKILEAFRQRGIDFSIINYHPRLKEVRPFTHLVSSGFSKRISAEILNNFQIIVG